MDCLFDTPYFSTFLRMKLFENIAPKKKNEVLKDCILKKKDWILCYLISVPLSNAFGSPTR